MTTVTVPVIAEYEYQGRSLRVGDDLTVEPLEAAVLARLGVVSLVTGIQVVKPKIDRRRREYRRRDMTAQR